MKSRVFFIPVSESDPIPVAQDKLRCLLNQSNLLDFLKPLDSVAVKLHFGEEGNTGFVKPEYLKVVCTRVKEKQATPFLSDSNTLYRGSRTNSNDHLKLAYRHGFTSKETGAEVIIPDDTEITNNQEININQRFIKQAHVLSVFIKAQALIGVAHFKGHMMTGFGGALKNIGMGCATRQGKLEQHSDIAPIIYLNSCVGCGACAQVCLAKAISIKNKKAIINNAGCIGCASCIAACHNNAIDVQWVSGKDTIQNKLIEYAKAILDSKKKKRAFINFCLKITKECDCLAKDDPRIIPDLGIFVSVDPVAIDKACLDMVNEKAARDIFRELHPNVDGLRQLEYAQDLGLGRLKYDLVLV